MMKLRLQRADTCLIYPTQKRKREMAFGVSERMPRLIEKGRVGTLSLRFFDDEGSVVFS